MTTPDRETLPEEFVRTKINPIVGYLVHSASGARIAGLPDSADWEYLREGTRMIKELLESELARRTVGAPAPATPDVLPPNPSETPNSSAGRELPDGDGEWRRGDRKWWLIFAGDQVVFKSVSDDGEASSFGSMSVNNLFRGGWRRADAGEAGNPITEEFCCRARPAADPPQECDFPHCGCSRVASEAVESLIEQGWLNQGEAAKLREQLAAAEKRIEHAESALTAAQAELAAMRGAIDTILACWHRLNGWATCISNGEARSYSVNIAYRDLPRAQDAYSALMEIGQALSPYFKPGPIPPAEIERLKAATPASPASDPPAVRCFKAKYSNSLWAYRPDGIGVYFSCGGETGDTFRAISKFDHEQEIPYADALALLADRPEQQARLRSMKGEQA